MSAVQLSPTTWQLALVSVSRNVVDLFEMSPGPVVSWVGCVPLPSGGLLRGMSPSGIALPIKDAILISRGPTIGTGWGGLRPLFIRLMNLMRYPMGDVLLWTREANWTHVSHSLGSFPSDVVVHRNHIIFSDNGTHQMMAGRPE